MIDFRYDENIEATECLYKGKVVARLYDSEFKKGKNKEQWVNDCKVKKWTEEDVIDGTKIYMGDEIINRSKAEIFYQ